MARERTKLCELRRAVSSRAPEPGGGQEILAEVFGARPGEAEKMQGSQEAAGEKMVGLDWSLRTAGYCYYTSTLAPYCVRLQTHV